VIQRNITPLLLEALADTPVVMLVGARQTGKSTLVRWLASHEHPARYLTLDDGNVLAAAHHDPAGFLAGLDGPVVLDEVQRAPDLFLAIKAEVDRQRRPGRFLLTGSANVLLLPHLAQSLVGRMEIHALWPLSQGEKEWITEGFIDGVFSEHLPAWGGKPVSRTELLNQMVLPGGFPEIIGRSRESRRRAWFNAYVTTILQREVRDLAQIEGLTLLPRLLSLLAIRSTSLLNFSELSRSTAIPQTTLKRYLSLLETTFLIQTIPSWSGNLSKRLVKSFKIFFTDSGLMAHLLGFRADHDSVDTPHIGPLLENFVVMELRKQISWSRTQPQLFYFRTQTGREVDVILEDARGRMVAIEIKASATVDAYDFKSLKFLAEEVGERFHQGLVLYAGTEPIPFGPRLQALPVDALWRLFGPSQKQKSEKKK
jgi:uncharacterized protein